MRRPVPKPPWLFHPPFSPQKTYVRRTPTPLLDHPDTWTGVSGARDGSSPWTGLTGKSAVDDESPFNPGVPTPPRVSTRDEGLTRSRRSHSPRSPVGEGRDPPPV